MNLTKNEYRLLLDLLYMADWMLHARANEEEESLDTTAHRMVIQKLYSFAEEMGGAEYIEADAQLNEYIPSRLFEEKSGIFDLIGRYDNSAFWNELTSRLSERDMLEDHPDRDRRTIGPEEFQHLVEPYSDAYAEEFAEHGVERVRVVADVD